MNIWHKHTNKQGFTLIEVLVAAFILFIVISAVTMVYRGALLSSFKAEKSLSQISYVSSITDEIRFVIKHSGLSSLKGDGVLGATSYNWVAHIVRENTPPPLVDQETNATVKAANSFKLWKISLQVNTGNVSREYSFYEVSW